jgi:hypothetical protein
VEIDRHRAQQRIALAILLSALTSMGCGGNSPSPAAVDAADASAYLPPDTSSGDIFASQDGPVTFPTWPGDSTVSCATHENALGTNVSGLVYEPASTTSPTILWAIQNDPSKLYRLVWDGTAYVPSTGDGWTTGKALRYTDGSGDPDSEGITRTDWGTSEIYVVAERDNDHNQVIRNTILRYDLSGSKGVIGAAQQWEMDGDLPATALNEGLEGIAWIPDDHLVQKAFFDDSRQVSYAPAVYPNHGTGVFFVAVKGSGMVYGYVLDLAANTFTRVTTFSSGLAHANDLFFDRDLGTLWVQCGDKCNNAMTLLDIDTDSSSPTLGHFVLRATIPRPKALKNENDEGLSMVPESECSNGHRSIFWSDDSDKGGCPVRMGGVTCGSLY